ncbi:3-hydroxyacyl-[acyl-carrier-protein] dehydratase FabZ [Kangiella profundi]|uniref:3-hydroxyacyl-[acyl-carrier-protein] dehydratase FabZ n=2 Tax=Kangiella profundi TaxID=1561924 RepID=A0A2K9AUH8_9GAMM|nr:3-hydroxyacyl-ACP dehydratase FabZ [Kangiella profundi]AUD80083.1 3-hydroxyacyl-[acyl-carrier-protein] dehydratase FabZ [Kangiella profundi]
MNSMDIYEVMKHLPHRYPFLLVDRVVDYKAGEYLKAIKNVTVNEPFFPGHFPHRPVFPGVLMLEAMAQASGILAFKTTEDLPTDDSLFYFVGIDDARFKKPVEPGDQLVMEVTVLKRKRDMWKFAATATVDGKVVCSAELMCAKKDIV